MAKSSGAATKLFRRVGSLGISLLPARFMPPGVCTTLRSSLAADTSHGAWSADRDRAASIAWAHCSKPARIAPRRDDRS
jgi:hypothetical protein